MGRLLAVGLLVLAVGVAVIVVNGAGENKPEERETSSGARESGRVAERAPGGEKAKQGEPKAAAARPGVTVRMTRMRFRPESVTVEPGQAVRFVNDDDVAHAVLEDVGPRSGRIAAIDSKPIRPGEKFQVVAQTARVIPYVCWLHPSVMVGQILVEKPAV